MNRLARVDCNAREILHRVAQFRIDLQRSGGSDNEKRIEPRGEASPMGEFPRSVAEALEALRPDTR
jgi:hypothetical protein